MIQFRCWYCNRRLSRPEADIGARFVCQCGHRAKVPRRSGGSSKSRSLTDWLMEALIYGGCGALFGFFVGFMLAGRTPIGRRAGVEVIVGFTLAGFVAGTLFGETGINWIGRKVRDRENE